MKNRLWFIPSFIIVVTLLIIGSLFDLNVSSTIVNLNNGFSRFMAGFTIFPIATALGFMLGSLIKVFIKKVYSKKWQNVLLIVIIIAISVGAFYLLGLQVTNYHAYNLSIYFSFVFGFVFMLPGYILGYLFYEKMNKENLIKTYLLIFLTVIFLIAFVEASKILLPRLRYTSIIKLSTENYRPWYLVDFSLTRDFVKEYQLVSCEEIKSFPSGHSNLAISSAFAYLFLPKFFPRFKNKEVFFFYGGFLFYLLIAFSRIYNGAHYLSDVMFTGTIAVSIYFISNEIYLRKLA